MTVQLTRCLKGKTQVFKLDLRIFMRHTSITKVFVHRQIVSALYFSEKDKRLTFASLPKVTRMKITYMIIMIVNNWLGLFVEKTLKLWVIISQDFKKDHISCQNFWDKAWWFLSLRVFGLLSSSLLLFPQRFGRYVLRPSSGVNV